MAASQNGVILALLFYCILQSFSSQKVTKNLYNDGSYNKQQFGYNYCAERRCNISMGQNVLYNTLLSPTMTRPVEGRGNRPTAVNDNRTVPADKLLFCVCLLVCGDIHPCPGPRR